MPTLSVQSSKRILPFRGAGYRFYRKQLKISVDTVEIYRFTSLQNTGSLSSSGQVGDVQSDTHPQYVYLYIIICLLKKRETVTNRYANTLTRCREEYYGIHFCYTFNDIEFYLQKRWDFA